MPIISKIKFFFILCLIATVPLSCNKENDVIPDVIVDFHVDINDARFSTDLNTLGGAVIINALLLNEPYAAGFNGSGIIVARGVDEYYAYDRTCPHEYSLDGSIVKVNIDPQAFAKAVCSGCNSTYELISFGTPSSGISRYPLKNYRTSFDGRFIRVWNN